jgi:hypothetical protein
MMQFGPDRPMPHPSSATFWSLADRWRVPDEQVLELISYEGKLPTTGQRPRFRLSAEQARNTSTLFEIDSALAAAGIRHGCTSGLTRCPDARGKMALSCSALVYIVIRLWYPPLTYSGPKLEG